MPESKRSLWKILRWVVLAALVLVVLLMISKPPPLAPPVQSADVARKASDFQAKVERLAQARQSGEQTEERFDSDEVNAAMQQAGNQAAATSGEVQTSLTTQVFFRDDIVLGQFPTEVLGKAVVVTVTGRLTNKDGYVEFAPTEFKIGNMPIPVSMVESTLQRKLAEPETREKLKLPSFVSDLRVERGQLVVVER
jgi:uncharacterized protein YpmS